MARCFCPQFWLAGRQRRLARAGGPHSVTGSSGNCEAEDLQYLYVRGLVVGAAKRLLASIINL